MVGIWVIAASMLVSVENQSIDPLSEPKGTITIVRDEGEKVEGFQYGGDPFFPRLVLENPRGEQIESQYEFSIPFENPGLVEVPKISVDIGGKKVEAPKRFFTVNYQVPDDGLVLKAYVYGEEPFYPGERLVFVYKIFYKGNIELTEEELPLIHVEGFKKIGELEVQDYEYKGYQVREIRQRVEIIKPGEFSVPQSLMKGILGKTEEIETIVEPFSIEVLPLPIRDVPPSFTGAVGDWSISSKLLSESSVVVGEKILLEVTLSGSGNIELLSLPSIFCMPGFSGFFSSTGNPIVSKEENGKKMFYIELIPSTAEIDFIPPVQFTSLHQKKGNYVTIETNPIPLKVAGKLEIPKFPEYVFTPSEVNWKEYREFPVELKEIKVGKRYSKYLYWLIPFLLPLQYYLRKGWIHYRRKKFRVFALAKAEKYSLEDPHFFDFLKEALEGMECSDIFSLLNRAKFGRENIQKSEILEKAWQRIS